MRPRANMNDVRNLQRRALRRLPVASLVSLAVLTACGSSSTTDSTGSTPTVAETTATSTAPPTTAATEATPSTVEFEFQNDPVLADLQPMFDDYASLVSIGREGEAYDRYAGPVLQTRITRDDFIEGNSTSTIDDLVVYRAFWLDVEQTTAEAWVIFTSFQGADFGPDGQTCTVWDLTYTMLRTDAGWQIQAATNGPDSPNPC